MEQCKIIFPLFFPILFFFISTPNAQTTNYGFYYVSGSGAHGIYLAQKDSQGKWKRGEGIKLDGQFDGNSVDPDILRLDDGRYRLFYYKGYFISPPPPNYTTHEIYSAISNDGINFTVEGKVFESDNITDPSVIRLNDGSYLMVCVRGSLDLFAKSNDGKNFQATGVTIQNGGIPELAKLDDGSIRLFYNGPGGIISSRSTNNGLTWTKENGTRLSSANPIADPSIVKRTDGKWYLYVKGFNNTGAQNPAGHNVLLSESNDCYTFTFINGVLLDSASVPDGVALSQSADVENKNKELLPNKIALYQNFPNPFNGETIISYYLHVSGYVTLKIYDVLGREITTLVNEIQSSGYYHSRLSVDGYQLPTGIYFYRIKVNGLSQTKKMVYLK
jgi:hypothetical protein